MGGFKSVKVLIRLMSYKHTNTYAHTRTHTRTHRHTDTQTDTQLCTNTFMLEILNDMRSVLIFVIT